MFFRNLVNRVKRILDEETGDIYPVKNQDRYRTANPYYFAVRLRHDGWSDARECFLFTEHELESARVRAQKNREDLPWCDLENCECGR